MSDQASGRAPGKVILLGEHFVVHGVPALASAIDRGIEVEASLAPGEGITIFAEGAESARSTAMVETILGELRSQLSVGGGVKPARTGSLEIHVRSEIPASAGLGASAAFSVASTRALAKLFGLEISDDDLFRVALAAETHAHGTPSGIDPYTSVYAGIVLYETGPPRRAVALTPPGPLDLVVAVTSGKRDTGEMVARAAAFAERDKEGFQSLLDSARRLSVSGRGAIEAGDLSALGGLMNKNHSLLQALGVSTAGLDTLVDAARAAGAFGAKLTGAGGGGAMIALCPGRQDMVAAACERAGASEVIRVQIGARTG